ncbi:MAG TPA: YicC/YloC family endoribonuclease [Woeseiaceae bacterium]|nr:YicC/YloC family endoribonuclease [Woeseiaceae bacterium]
MLHSMTGFARHTAELADGVLTCELRSVNHRWLDVQLRLPDELRPAESEIRKRIGAALKRGKVECALHLRRAPATRAALALNQPVLDQLHAAFTALAATFPNLRAPDPVDLLRWPGVIEEPDDDAAGAGLPLEEAMQALDTALDALTAMRASEGERIAEMLEIRCRDLLSIAESVRVRMPEVLEAARARQKERLEKLDVEADPARVAAELALMAQKQDVDEELDRLTSHVSEIRQVIDSGEPVGRRLDFLMQELNREANTLGSKAGDTETTRAAVELKVLVEQMREQIQNVE